MNGGEEVNYSGCQDGSRSTTRPLVTWAVVPVARVTVWMWKGRPSSWSPPRAKPIRAPSGDQDERDPAVVAGEGRPGRVVGAGDGDEDAGEQGQQGEPLGPGEHLPCDGGRSLGAAGGAGPYGFSSRR